MIRILGDVEHYVKELERAETATLKFRAAVDKAMTGMPVPGGGGGGGPSGGGGGGGRRERVGDDMFKEEMARRKQMARETAKVERLAGRPGDEMVEQHKEKQKRGEQMVERMVNQTEKNAKDEAEGVKAANKILRQETKKELKKTATEKERATTGVGDAMVDAHKQRQKEEKEGPGADTFLPRKLIKETEKEEQRRRDARTKAAGLAAAEAGAAAAKYVEDEKKKSVEAAAKGLQNRVKDEQQGNRAANKVLRNDQKKEAKKQADEDRSLQGKNNFRDVLKHRDQLRRGSLALQAKQDDDEKRQQQLAQQARDRQAIRDQHLREARNVREREKEGRSVGQMAGAVKQTTGQMAQTFAMVSGAIAAPIAAVLYQSINDFAKFDNAIVESQAIMKVNEQQNLRMRDTAMQVGSSTKFAANEISNAYYHLASSGLDTEQSIAAVGTVAAFAQAGVMSLHDATSMLTNAQGALNLKHKDAEQNMIQMTRVADVLVKANILSDATTQQFAKALTADAAPSMRAFHKELEEGVAVLAVYADQGIKAEKAGGHLGRALRFISDRAVKNKAEFRRMGIEVFDSGGKMKNMADIIRQLEDSMGDKSDRARTKIYKKLGFEARMRRAIDPLIGKSGDIRRYEAELKGAGGSSAEVAAKQMLSFTNQMKRMNNQIETVSITIGEQLAPALLFVTDIVAVAVEVWHSFPSVLKAIVVFAGVGMVAFAALAAGIVVAGVAFNFAFAGVGYLIGAVVTAVAMLYMAVGALVGAWFGLFIGLTGGFLGIRKYFVDVWKMIGGPIKDAFASLLKTVKELGTAVFSAGSALLSWQWGQMVGRARTSWAEIGMYVTAAIYFIEYSITHMDKVAAYWLIGMEYRAVQLYNILSYFFLKQFPTLVSMAFTYLGEVLPPVGKFMVTIFNEAFDIIFENFTAMWGNAFTVVIRVMKNLIAQIWEIVSNQNPDIDEIFKGVYKDLPRNMRVPNTTKVTDELGKNLDEITKKFKDTKFELGNVPNAREKGQVEKDLEAKFNQAGKMAGEGFNRFFMMKMRHKDKKDPSAEQKGEEIGDDLVKGAMRHLEKFDSALFDSAESATRWQHYMERIMDPEGFPDEAGNRFPRGKLTGEEAGGAAALARGDRQEEFLKNIDRNTKQLVDKKDLKMPQPKEVKIEDV